MELTLSIIKPNAVAKNAIGEIIRTFESQGLRVVACKMARISPEKWELFYAEHRQKPFFSELVEFMSSGPVVLMVLEGPQAVARNREIMGATDPVKAAPGTLRARFGDSVGANAVHGSDSLESARREIALFFEPYELVNRSGAVDGHMGIRGP